MMQSVCNMTWINWLVGHKHGKWISTLHRCYVSQICRSKNHIVYPHSMLGQTLKAIDHQPHLGLYLTENLTRVLTTRPGISNRKLNKGLINQATINIPSYVHQSSLKTRSSHPLKFILLQTSCDTYKYSFWPRTTTDWNSLLSEFLLIDSATKF